MRTKKVFTDRNEIAHLWSNQIQDDARNSSGTFYFRNETIYSYGSHFPIAKHVTNSKGEKAVLFVNWSYSVSTSKHIQSVRHAANHLNIIYCRMTTGNSYSGGMLGHDGNFQAWENTINAIALKLAKARKPEIHLNAIAAEFSEAKKYAEFFGIKIPKTLQLAGDITSKDKFSAYHEKRQKALKAEEAKKTNTLKKMHTEELENWRNFKTYSRSMYHRNREDYLRFDPLTDRIETSQGIQIPLEIGHTFYKLVLRVRASGGCKNCEHTILGYSVKEINKAFIQVGCHKIDMLEIQKLALSLGWE